MCQVFQTYPEMVLMDATYNLVDLCLPVYIPCAIDGNGMTEVVFVFLAFHGISVCHYFGFNC